MEVRSRHHLRSDTISEIQTVLSEQLGVEVEADSYEKVELADSDWDVVLVDGDPLVVYYAAGDGENATGDEERESDGETPFLTVRGANAHPPEKRVVTVDAGAIQFVSNGADVMRPGIVAADEVIEAGDLVVVSEETHGKFLAIGRALVDAEEMTGEEGRVVESLHHVGDDLYELVV